MNLRLWARDSPQLWEQFPQSESGQLALEETINAPSPNPCMFFWEQLKKELHVIWTQLELLRHALYQDECTLQLMPDLDGYRVWNCGNSHPFPENAQITQEWRSSHHSSNQTMHCRTCGSKLQYHFFWSVFNQACAIVWLAVSVVLDVLYHSKHSVERIPNNTIFGSSEQCIVSREVSVK